MGKERNHKMCHFINTLLNGNPELGEMNWKDVLSFTVAAARVISDYGKVAIRLNISDFVYCCGLMLIPVIFQLQSDII